MSRTYKNITLGGRFIVVVNPTDLNNPLETGTKLGLTRGAAVKFGEGALRHIEVDGQLGAVKGGTRITDIQPSIEFDIMEINKQTLTDLGRYTSTTNGRVSTFEIKSEIEEDVDYLDQLVLVGLQQDGTQIMFILRNALLSTLPDIAFSDKDEVPMKLMFMGHYESADSRVVPFTIITQDPITNEQAGDAAAQIAPTLVFEYEANSATTTTEFMNLMNPVISGQLIAAIDTDGYPDALIDSHVENGSDTISDILGATTEPYPSFKLNLKTTTTGFEGSPKVNDIIDIQIQVIAPV